MTALKLFNNGASLITQHLYEIAFGFTEEECDSLPKILVTDAEMSVLERWGTWIMVDFPNAESQKLCFIGAFIFKPFKNKKQ